MKKLIHVYLYPKRFSMLLCFIIKFSGTIVELLLPWMLSVILDKHAPQKDLNNVFLWGFFMILTAASALILNILANRLATKVSRDVIQLLRYDLFYKTKNLSSDQQDKITTPSLISRLTSDTYNVYQMIDRMQRLGVRAPILLIGGTFVTFLLEPILTLVLIVIMPLLGFLIFWISHKGITLFTSAQQALDNMVLHAQESMNGIRVIKALSKDEYEINQFSTINTQATQSESKANMITNLSNPIMNLLLNIGLSLVILIGAYRVNAGIIMPGIIIAFLSYFTLILTALMMISRMFVMFSKGVASANRISQVLDLEESPIIKALPTIQSDDHIYFDHVSFSYEKVKDTVSDIHFHLKRGETLGILGPTGSGKSTIINLLLRFYDPDHGNIYINGENLQSIPFSKLYQFFGVVFQNDFLYAQTLANNIDFGRNLSNEDLQNAIQIAQADFINQNGLDANLTSKGTNLSGGQKQRLLISRAVAANPSILILDDSSSALDYKTDAALRKALATKLPTTTKIIVAQRISSIKNANQIMLLDNGKIGALGTHKELMKTNTMYQRIADAQMKEVE